MQQIIIVIGYHYETHIPNYKFVQRHVTVLCVCACKTIVLGVGSEWLNCAERTQPATERKSSHRFTSKIVVMQKIAGQLEGGERERHIRIGQQRATGSG